MWRQARARTTAIRCKFLVLSPVAGQVVVRLRVDGVDSLQFKSQGVPPVPVARLCKKSTSRHERARPMAGKQHAAPRCCVDGPAEPPGPRRAAVIVTPPPAAPKPITPGGRAAARTGARAPSPTVSRIGVHEIAALTGPAQKTTLRRRPRPSQTCPPSRSPTPPATEPESANRNPPALPDAGGMVDGHLANRLGLTAFEQNVLLLAAAPELDTRIAGLCARAQDDPQTTVPDFRPGPGTLRRSRLGSPVAGTSPALLALARHPSTRRAGADGQRTPRR